MTWYFQCWCKYADFRGRARRREYWYWTLFNAIFGLTFVIAGGVFFGMIGLNLGSTADAGDPSQASTAIGGGVIGAFVGYFLALAIWSLITLIPGLTVGIRRLHDVGRSEWWIMLLPTVLNLSSIPLANSSWEFVIGIAEIAVWIWILVLCCTDSDPCENQWGPTPKYTGGYAYPANFATAPAAPQQHLAPQPPPRPAPSIAHPHHRTSSFPAAASNICQTCGTTMNGTAICQTCGAASASLH